MLFSGLTFLYYFLPAVLIAYFLVPDGWKNGVLLFFSLFFYAWGEPKLALLMVVTILVFYLCGLAIGRANGQAARKRWMIVSVAIGLGLLGLFKYADFFIGSINAVTGLSLPLLRLVLPIGISFYTFQCISYTVDVYRGNAAAQKNLISFGCYVSLFPQLIAGPIVRYTDVARELEGRTHSMEAFTLGLRRFLFGLGKKVLLANQFGALTTLYRDSKAQSVLYCWLYALAFALQIYFDFSGYSDMAIGLGQIFGFRFPENFNYPYLSRSITEFWRRWHMTLGGLVPGLCLYSPGGQPGDKTPVVFEHPGRLDAHGAVARCQLEFCAVGVGVCGVPAAGKGNSGASEAAKGTIERLCNAGGGAQFCAVQCREHFPGGGGSGGDVWPSRTAAGDNRIAVSAEKLCGALFAGHSGGYPLAQKMGRGHGAESALAGRGGHAGAAAGMHGLPGGRLL